MTRSDPGRPDRRSDARERALYLLYEATQKAVSVDEVLAAQVVPADDLTTLLVTGVAAHRERLDAAIAARAEGWPLARMPLLDLDVLRLGAFELAERPDVPVAVVIDEAVELAKRFSTDNSGRFVNGVLAALAAELRPDSAAELRPDSAAELRPDSAAELRPDSAAELRPDSAAEQRLDSAAELRPDSAAQQRLGDAAAE